MIDALSALIDAFVGLDVLVIGEAMLDSYLEGSAVRLSPEAPVPVVAIAHRTDVPGGAANTALNVAALGGDVHFLSVIGDDAEGALLRRTLTQRGVNVDCLLIQPSRQTLTKHRVLAGSQMLVRFDQGSTEAVDPAMEDALIDRLMTLFPSCAAVIISDYGYGVMTPRVIDALAHLQAESPRVLAADAKNLLSYREAHVTVAKPSYRDAVRLLGLHETEGTRIRLQQIASSSEQLLSLTGADLVAVTLDSDGALFLDRGCPPYRTFARAVRHVSAAGAGDTFASALTLALAAGADTPQAAELASAAAAVVVAKEGTATCLLQELRECVAAEAKCLAGVERLLTRIKFHRQQGQRIIFTNGCFDILHRGHIACLNHAKALGDVLVVGVNSDASVQRLKGLDRPINGLEDRTQVLAALSSVDYIVPFEEDSPEELIRAICPDIYVKGGDYSRETLPEASLVEGLGGNVQILPYLEDRSTTRVVERIRLKAGHRQAGPPRVPSQGT